MSKVKKISVTNLKAISSLTADFNGCTAIITGGNNRGKSSFLRSLPDRLRGVKPEIIVRSGEADGSAEWELTTGEKFIWSFDTKTKAGERLVFVTKENIKTSLTRDLCNRFFPPVFDVDAFLSAGPKKQNEMLQKLAGIDFSIIEGRHKMAYDERTNANRKRDDLKATVSNIPAPEKAEMVVISELIKQKENIRTELNNKYLENKKHNEGLRKSWTAEKSAIDAEVLLFNNEQKERANMIMNRGAVLSRIAAICSEHVGLKDLVDCSKLIKHIEQLPRPEPNKTATDLYPPEPEYIPELPDDTRLQELDKEINEANETNQKAQNYEDYKKQLADLSKAEVDADEADKKVKEIEKEKMDMVKSATLPNGFAFSDDGILYNNLPFTKEQQSSSGLYIAALKLAALTLGEVKTLHFDASFLDKNSLSEIESWANENDLQLLIERPDFEGGDIEYHLLNPAQ